RRTAGRRAARAARPLTRRARPRRPVRSRAGAERRHRSSATLSLRDRLEDTYLRIICNCIMLAKTEGGPARLGAYRSSPFFPVSGGRPNLLFWGKRSGLIRPASARFPRQGASSFKDRAYVRLAESTQVSPSSALKVFTSDRPPSL